MNTPAPARGSWGRVEFYTSFFLLAVLATVIGMRLGFESVWHLPTLDLDLSVVALSLVIASFWLARHSRHPTGADGGARAGVAVAVAGRIDSRGNPDGVPGGAVEEAPPTVGAHPVRDAFR